MGSIKKFYTRAELGMRAPRSVSNAITPQHGGVAVHYAGAAQKVTSQTQARARWVSYQNYHMDTHGWVDIAYTAGFDNWGNVYPGRGYGARTAGQGTNEGNQNFYAFCWIGGGNEHPSEAALNALNWLIEDARKNGNAGTAVKPHRFFKSTACPGDLLEARAKELDGKATLPSVGEEKPAPTPAPSPAPTGAWEGKHVRAKVDLRYYDGPRWTNPTGVINAGTVFGEVLGVEAVGGGHQYKVKTTSGTRYLTASDRFVDLVNAPSVPTPTPAPTPSWQGKHVRAKVDLRFYNGARWTNPTGTISAGTVFGEVLGRHSVGGGYQYSVRTSSGTRYITASDRFVDLVNAPSQPAPAPTPSWQGKQVRAKIDVNFYSRPGWAPSNSPAGVLKKGYRFGGGIHDRRAVGGGFQYQVSNSNGHRYWITTSSKYVELVNPPRRAVVAPPTESSTTLRKGMKGDEVKEWQASLKRWRLGSLPRFGINGDFGRETLDWTRRFQSANGIVVDGVVGPQTRRTMESVLNS